MKNDIVHDFLTSFFALFAASLKDVRIENQKVLGDIEWKDEEERQSFSWMIVYEESVLLGLKVLCEYLLKYNLIQGDKIIVSESKLKKKLIEIGWNANKAEENINWLCSLRIKMIDDGEETDSFLIHF